MRWLDLLHAKYHNDGLFFRDGFGKPEILAESLVQKAAPPPIKLRPLQKGETSRVLRFDSPRADCLPECSKIAEALLVLPDDWGPKTPVCVQLASTGDEGFSDRQKFVAEPLAELGIGSVILETPYYGVRRPSSQTGTYLNTVSDLWAMGLAMVSEARTLLDWLGIQGFQYLGICGVSMGGAMASQAAALCSRPLAVCACIAPHSATPVFTEDVLSRYVDWESLGGETKGKEKLAKQLDGSNLRLFPLPVRPDCCTWLLAKRDAYVAPSSSLEASKAWPGSRVQWLNNGHVGTAMFHKNQYLKEIKFCFQRLKSPAPESDAWFP